MSAEIASTIVFLWRRVIIASCDYITVIVSINDDDIIMKNENLIATIY